ncbi:outer membrane protein, multidrug efflux system [Duganella sp. CF402]|uniref:efflux transporter outer membrane subunit n=1 Tax=unclassified Duganella TaxID=2636909 RepID=UPI0008B435E3|nr:MULTISPECIES: efflux transporter outer membrane subunit [unclassified Duganella]RZT10991.1 multidrug efflux system outer membrane protein [Duganella sp. BK701]SEK86628.1 outer membrane protein, multidrug efflux system [Duganella sp. CF402]
MKTPTILVVAAAVAIALAGCASVPPDRNALAKRDIAGAELSANIKLAQEGWPQVQWWTAYHDEQLNAIIKQALASGPSLEVAAAHIGSARSSLSRSVADLGISGTVNGNANRQRYSGTGLFPAPIGGAYFTEETLRLDLRYNFDWWGKNRAQVSAAVGELNAGRAAYAEAEQALAASIAQSYFRLQGAWARLENTDQLAATQTALVQDRAKRIARGLASADEQRAAEAELNLIRKQQAQLRADIEYEREALRALAGADNTALADLKPVAVSPAPHALPARLGMELMARRPDLQAARWTLEASLSKIDAAKAAFYPDVNLTGSIGLNSVKAEDLLQLASRTLYIGPSVSLPLFDSKRLDAQLDGARTNRNERIAEYNQTIVEAVREVAQGGAQLQGIEQQIVQQTAATTLARAQLASAQARMDHGLANNSSVLNARLSLLKQRDADLYLQQVQLLAEVALTNALGGGYHEEAPLATAIK